MNLRKKLIIMGLCAVMVLSGSVFSVMAGDGPEPPEGAIILDEVVWGVVVIYCPADDTTNIATIRVKRVDAQNCIVATDVAIDTDWSGGCMAKDLLIGETINQKFFGMQNEWPYISKVKNYQKVGDTLTFDAQIKFWK